ncbi:hypothetical protein Pla8534_71460 [Lignipirellula cremea]|uniref:Uncharacterized protein n=1 Tax=Lignipirellula cremea TaxID=2528010 RepID=A0A518E578_9BACT|nr:hypothetical protein Pla8534_71460 [Lignipirellula cremea]
MKQRNKNARAERRRGTRLSGIPFRVNPENERLITDAIANVEENFPFVGTCSARKMAKKGGQGALLPVGNCRLSAERSSQAKERRTPGVVPLPPSNGETPEGNGRVVSNGHFFASWGDPRTGSGRRWFLIGRLLRTYQLIRTAVAAICVQPRSINPSGDVGGKRAASRLTRGEDQPPVKSSAFSRSALGRPAGTNAPSQAVGFKRREKADAGRARDWRRPAPGSSPQSPGRRRWATATATRQSPRPRPGRAATAAPARTAKCG